MESAVRGAWAYSAAIAQAPTTPRVNAAGVRLQSGKSRRLVPLRPVRQERDFWMQRQGSQNRR